MPLRVCWFCDWSVYSDCFSIMKEVHLSECAVCSSLLHSFCNGLYRHSSSAFSFELVFCLSAYLNATGIFFCSPVSPSQYVQVCRWFPVSPQMLTASCFQPPPPPSSRDSCPVIVNLLFSSWTWLTERVAVICSATFTSLNLLSLNSDCSLIHSTK